MSSYYDLRDDQKQSMNVDYDFCACLENNPQPFNLLDVDRVLAVIEGERDSEHWHWVVKLRDGQSVYLRGWCDYTGWDCQSWATTVYLSNEKTLVKAIEEASQYDSDDDKLRYYHDLAGQIAGEKKTTWRETMDNEFGL